MSYSAGWVGLPEQEGSLIPGEDYLSVVGEDLCALGESFADVINEGVGRARSASSAGRRATPCPWAGSSATSRRWARGSMSSIPRPRELDHR